MVGEKFYIMVLNGPTQGPLQLISYIGSDFLVKIPAENDGQISLVEKFRDTFTV